MFGRHGRWGIVLWFATAGPGLGLAAETALAFEAYRNEVYVERQSGPLTADVFVPPGEGPFPALIVVHGGAWARGTKEQLSGVAAHLAVDGYTTVAINYRLAPAAMFPAQVHDCQAAVRWLRTNAARFKVDPERIGGYGYSAGGHLVAMLGALADDELREDGLPDDAPSARIQLVVAGGAPCDFETLAPESQRLVYWLGGTPGEKPDIYRQASPATYVTGDEPPMFFFHGTADDLVPIDSVRRMVERLRQAEVETTMVEVAGAGHAGAVRDGEALEKALEFTNRHLKGAGDHGR